MIHVSGLPWRLAAMAAAGLVVGGIVSPAAPALAAAGRARTVAAPAAAHVFRTQATGLRVRARATTRSRQVGVLGKAGSKVTVSCFELGQPIAGDAVWYRITKPKTGYVAGFYLKTGGDPAAGVPRCFYRTKVTGLAVRKAATAKSRRLGVLGTAGSRVTVRCFALGQAIAGDTVWYRITKPKTGYVAGFYLNTGRDPAAGIARC
jgi:Bacterial SH3 domain